MSQVVLTKVAMPRIRVSIDVALIGPPHLHCQTESVRVIMGAPDCIHRQPFLPSGAACQLV